MVFDEMVNLDENSISKEEFNKMHSKHNWKTISNFILKSDDFSFKKFLKVFIFLVKKNLNYILNIKDI